MKATELDPTTTIQDIEEIPESKGFLFRGNMCIETQMDEFDSAEKTRTPVWLWKGENRGLVEVLNIWQNSVLRSASLECIRFKTKGTRILIVFRPGDHILKYEDLAEDEQAEFAAAISYACIMLCDAGLMYTRWTSSCVAKHGVSWKILPVGNLKITDPQDRATALATLGEWFSTLPISLFRSEPALSIIKMMRQKKIPDEMYEELGYQTFWQKLEKFRPPLKIDVQTNETSVNLRWDPTIGNVLFRILDPKEIPPCGTLIPRNAISKIGKDFCTHPNFRPHYDEMSGTALWLIPTNESKYEVIQILPLVENGDWFQPGIPFRAGGPPDIHIYNAWFDSETQECVLAFNWDTDPNIESLRILFRTDRYAETPNDLGEIRPVLLFRESINYPLRKKIPFQSKLFITVFSVVKLNGRLCCSPGQKSRAIVSRTEESNTGSPPKRIFW